MHTGWRLYKSPWPGIMARGLQHKPQCKMALTQAETVYLQSHGVTPMALTVNATQIKAACWLLLKV